MPKRFAISVESRPPWAGSDCPSFPQLFRVRMHYSYRKTRSRIIAGRAAGRDVAGQKRNGGEEQRGLGERRGDRAAARHTAAPARVCSAPMRRAGPLRFRRQPARATSRITSHTTFPALRPESHADSDLARPSRHHVRHDAVESDDRQHGGQRAEARPESVAIIRSVISDSSSWLFERVMKFVSRQVGRRSPRTAARIAAKAFCRIALRADVDHLSIGGPLRVAEVDLGRDFIPQTFRTACRRRRRRSECPWACPDRCRGRTGGPRQGRSRSTSWAKVALTTATFGASPSSFGVKTRPCKTGTPSVSK